MTDNPRSFTAQRAWKRFIICCRAPLANFLLAVLLMLALYANAYAFFRPVIADFMKDFPWKGSRAYGGRPDCFH